MERRFQTVAAVTSLKMLLMLYNIIFWATGIVIFCFGLWMKISLHNLLELSDDYNDAAPYVFIGTGAVIVMVGFCACCCTVKGSRVLLYLLAVFLGIVFLLELAAGISGYIYRGNIQKGFETGLNNSIAHYGQGGIRDQDINILQTYLKCCGVNSYLDWIQKWQNDSVPFTCCRVQDQSCQHAPLTDTKDIYTSGCYVNVVDFVNRNLGAIGGGTVGLACFQLLGVILAYCLAKHVDKAKYEPMG